MGKHIFHVGPLGAGQTVKLVNQLVAGGIMTLIGEGFVLAKAAGVDLHALADVMGVSSGNSAVFEARGKKFLLANQFVPGFMTELMHKDVALAVTWQSGWVCRPRWPPRRWSNTRPPFAWGMAVKTSPPWPKCANERPA